MAEHEDVPAVEGDEENLGYKPPAEKSLETILATDNEDESLKKYKETLLGANPTEALIFPEDPRKVIVNKLALCATGRDDVELDLSGDITDLKQKSFIIKEGAQYRVKIYFYVQREIVTGLKYVQKSYRKGIQVDKTSFMVGSYGPKKELQWYQTPLEDAPTGMMARGTYNVKSLFTDDDKHEHLKWEWTLEIKKDWE